jgi:LysM repeat protein
MVEPKIERALSVQLQSPGPAHGSAPAKAQAQALGRVAKGFLTPQISSGRVLADNVPQPGSATSKPGSSGGPAAAAFPTWQLQGQDEPAPSQAASAATAKPGAQTPTAGAQKSSEQTKLSWKDGLLQGGLLEDLVREKLGEERKGIFIVDKTWTGASVKQVTKLYHTLGEVISTAAIAGANQTGGGTVLFVDLLGPDHQVLLNRVVSRDGEPSKTDLLEMLRIIDPSTSGQPAAVVAASDKYHKLEAYVEFLRSLSEKGIDVQALDRNEVEALKSADIKTNGSDSKNYIVLGSAATVNAPGGGGGLPVFVPDPTGEMGLGFQAVKADGANTYTFDVHATKPMSATASVAVMRNALGNPDIDDATRGGVLADMIESGVSTANLAKALGELSQGEIEALQGALAALRPRAVGPVARAVSAAICQMDGQPRDLATAFDKGIRIAGKTADHSNPDNSATITAALARVREHATRNAPPP